MSQVDVPQALDLKINHALSYAKIAAIQKVSPQAIHSKIKHLLPTVLTPVFVDNRANILAHNQMRLLSQLDDRRLKKVTVKDACVSFGILYDKERLEAGLSTANVAMQGTLDLVQSRSLAPIQRQNRGKMIDNQTDNPTKSDNYE